MSKFKVGDIVRIVKEHPGFDKDLEQSTVGKIGVIKGFLRDGEYKVFFDDIDDFWFYIDEYLELVSDDISPQYTYADVIIDPNDPRVEIGAKYYFADTPRECLDKANKRMEFYKLEYVENEIFPFNTDVTAWSCIIRKNKYSYKEDCQEENNE